MVKPDYIAQSARVENRQVHVELVDGSTHSFPTAYYPRLATASSADLAAITLRVGGRALRWESIDEDIWIADAILRLYPSQDRSIVAECP